MSQESLTISVNGNVEADNVNQTRAWVVGQFEFDR